MQLTDPWENTTGDDFFDDSLQDSTFYDTIKMYNSVADLEVISKNEEQSELCLVSNFNTFFSMEDISKQITTKNCTLLKRNIPSKQKMNSIRNPQEQNLQNRTLPINAVKPIIRSNQQDVNNLTERTMTSKKFAYRVSKI